MTTTNLHDVREAWWVALIDRTFSNGGKRSIDARQKWPEEGFTREWREVIVMPLATKRRIDEN
ncbi:MAG: hypothetical protein JSV86_01540 [Gemmatimonadota bacterium]|nr:MAG: hypothetical protein JSV86_01540 [Gemmatimonadota bacterium]